MDMLLLAISSAVIGILVGLLSGLLGVGGGTILVPIFKLAFGLPATTSTATSLFTIIPTSLSGAITHFKERTCMPLLGVAAGLGGACTSSLGVFLASISPEWAIMIAAATVIAYSAVSMFTKAMRLRKKKAESAIGDRSPSQDGAKAIADNIPKRGLIGFGALIGSIAGILSGYVGVGGGFLMMPMFMQLLNTPMKLTSGTSLIAVMILAIPGTVTNAFMGNIDWIAGCFVTIGTIPGAILGSKLIRKVPEFQLRLLFSAFLLVAAALLVVDQLGIL